MRTDAPSNSHDYTYANSHPYAERNHPSYSNPDADRLPWCMREPDPVSHSYANSDSYGYCDSDRASCSNAKSNGNAFAHRGSGVKHLDAAAG